MVYLKLLLIIIYFSLQALISADNNQVLERGTIKLGISSGFGFLVSLISSVLVLGLRLA